VLPVEGQPLAARHEHGRTAGVAEPGDDVRDCRQQVLGVVEQEQPPRAADPCDDRVEQRPARLLGHIERLRERHDGVRRIAQRRQRDPGDAVGERVGRGRRRLDREPRLARPARPGQRHEPDVVAT
jgi:hypothetical protein